MLLALLNQSFERSHKLLYILCDLSKDQATLPLALRKRQKTKLPCRWRPPPLCFSALGLTDLLLLDIFEEKPIANQKGYPKAKCCSMWKSTNNRDRPINSKFEHQERGFQHVERRTQQCSRMRGMAESISAYVRTSYTAAPQRCYGAFPGFHAPGPIFAVITGFLTHQLHSPPFLGFSKNPLLRSLPVRTITMASAVVFGARGAGRRSRFRLRLPYRVLAASDPGGQPEEVPADASTVTRPTTPSSTVVRDPDGQPEQEPVLPPMSCVPPAAASTVTMEQVCARWTKITHLYCLHLNHDNYSWHYILDQLLTGSHK